MSDDLRLHDLDLSGRWRAIVADEELRVVRILHGRRDIARILEG